MKTNTILLLMTLYWLTRRPMSSCTCEHWLPSLLHFHQSLPCLFLFSHMGIFADPQPCQALFWLRLLAAVFCTSNTIPTDHCNLNPLFIEVMIICIENLKYYQKMRSFWYGGSYLLRNVLCFWIGRLKIDIEEKLSKNSWEIFGTI